MAGLCVSQSSYFLRNSDLCVAKERLFIMIRNSHLRTFVYNHEHTDSLHLLQPNSTQQMNTVRQKRIQPSLLSQIFKIPVIFLT